MIIKMKNYLNNYKIGDEFSNYFLSTKYNRLAEDDKLIFKKLYTDRFNTFFFIKSIVNKNKILDNDVINICSLKGSLVKNCDENILCLNYEGEIRYLIIVRSSINKESELYKDILNNPISVTYNNLTDNHIRGDLKYVLNEDEYNESVYDFYYIIDEEKYNNLMEKFNI